MLIGLMAIALLATGACSSSDTAAPTTSSGTSPAPGGTPAGTTPGTTAGATGAAVDYGVPGPYKIGTQRLLAGTTNVIVFYPIDPKVADGLDPASHVTSYSSGEAFSPELRATVAGLVPELVQDIPIDAYRDAPISEEGPFPVVIHSHGFGGSYLFASQHFSQEASWGFVVAAPDHQSRSLSAVASGKVVTAGDPDVADLDATLGLLTRSNAASDSPLKGGLDTDLVGAEGHSAGGRASYLFAAKEARVKAWIGQAPSAPIPFAAGDQSLTPEQRLAAQQTALASAPVLGKPSMIVAGEKDSVIPLPGVRGEYEWLAPPKRLIVVANSGHAGFLDACEPIRAQGGLQKYAEKLPAFAPLFPLADDGCGADNLDPALASAFINHVMIAQYRYVFGLDPTPASLDPAYLRQTFPEAFLEASAKS